MSSILLTWGTWFVWSFMAEKLVEDKHNVILLKRTTSSLDKISHLIWNDLVKTIDIDRTWLDEVFENNQIDSVIHLATAYWRKWESASEIIEATLIYSIRLLEQAIKHKTASFLNTDSYFNNSIQLSDNIWLHAESKRDFIKYAKQLTKWSDIKFMNIVMGHVYWPRDDERKLIPAVIKQLLGNQEMKLVKGDNQRNFVYVKDLIRVYTTILDNIDSIDQNYQDFYDWTGEIVTVRQLVKKLKDITNSSSHLAFGAYPERENEIMTITPDMESKTHQLGWEAKYTIDQGLAETVEYYKSLS